MVERLCTNRRYNQINLRKLESRFLIVKEGSCKYEKGINYNEPCGGFQMQCELMDFSNIEMNLDENCNMYNYKCNYRNKMNINI